jgi:hypothetical protein
MACTWAEESVDLRTALINSVPDGLSQLAAVRARAPVSVSARPALRPARQCRHASTAGAETAVAPAHAPRPVAVPSFSEKEVQLFSKNRFGPARSTLRMSY